MIAALPASGGGALFVGDYKTDLDFDTETVRIPKLGSAFIWRVGADGTTANVTTIGSGMTFAQAAAWGGNTLFASWYLSPSTGDFNPSEVVESFTASGMPIYLLSRYAF